MLTDLRKELKPFYTASAKKPVVLDVPALQCLAIEGEGAPEGERFQRSVEAIYGAVYTLKFGLKKASQGEQDFNIMPLEGFWAFADGKIDDPGTRDRWRWKLVIVVPDWITGEHLQSALAQLTAKKDNAATDAIRLEQIHESQVVQMLHVGPYATEPETVGTMLRFAESHGYTCGGGHHEIYMSDPRRTEQTKLKTILRYKVEVKTQSLGTAASS